MAKKQNCPLTGNFSHNCVSRGVLHPLFCRMLSNPPDMIGILAPVCVEVTKEHLKIYGDKYALLHCRGMSSFSHDRAALTPIPTQHQFLLGLAMSFCGSQKDLVAKSKAWGFAPSAAPCSKTTGITGLCLTMQRWRKWHREGGRGCRTSAGIRAALSPDCHLETITTPATGKNWILTVQQLILGQSRLPEHVYTPFHKPSPGIYVLLGAKLQISLHRKAKPTVT